MVEFTYMNYQTSLEIMAYERDIEPTTYGDDVGHCKKSGQPSPNLSSEPGTCAFHGMTRSLKTKAPPNDAVRNSIVELDHPVPQHCSLFLFGVTDKVVSTNS